MKILKEETTNYNVNICNLESTNLNYYEIKSQFKKIFEIIYQYHVRGKKIAFVNIPLFVIKSLKKNIKKNKQHSFVPPNIWVHGIFTNRSAGLYSSIKRKKNAAFKLFLQLKQKNDLIVDLGHKKIEITNLLKENSAAGIPTIVLNKKKLKSIYLPTHSIQYNIISNEKNFFYTILQSILKKNIEIQKNIYKFDQDFYTKKKIVNFNRNTKYKNKKNKRYAHIKNFLQI